MISNPDLDSNFDYSVVVELRKAALETPLDPAAGIIPDQDLTTRDFEYGGYPIRVKMTLDKLADRWGGANGNAEHAASWNCQAIYPTLR